MTSTAAPADYIVLVPTGAWTGGTITVDYLHPAGSFEPQALVRQVGTATFSSAGYSVSKNVVLESASHGVQVGDIVKGTLKFRMTDYY